MFCKKCGKWIADDAVFCNFCGANQNEVANIQNTTNEADTNSSTVDMTLLSSEGTAKENTSKKPISKKAKLGIIIGSILIVILAIIIGFALHSHNHAQQVENYHKALEKYAEHSLESAATCEKISNMTSSVWHDSIFQKEDKDTNPYTKKNGVFREDFNDSLEAWFKSKKYEKLYDKVTESQKKATDLYEGTLRNAPEEYEEEYQALSELNKQTLAYVELATNPTGNYDTYMSSFTNQDNDYMKAYNTLKALL